MSTLSPRPQSWPTFSQILQRLHHEGIYLQPAQLAEFLLTHGLPVDLQYVPPHLQAKARLINQNYQGDMACFQENLESLDWGEFS